MQPPSKDSQVEVTLLKDELQLVLKKEKEARVAVHTLVPVTTMFASLHTQFMSLCLSEGIGRPAFIFGLPSTPHRWLRHPGSINFTLWSLLGPGFELFDMLLAFFLQCVLEQLVSEYNKLNDALRAEKRLYQNLVQVQNKGDR